MTSRMINVALRALPKESRKDDRTGDQFAGGRHGGRRSEQGFSGQEKRVLMTLSGGT